ncbi:MAG: DUF6273 domain-containing protein [bacterium]|nr:DUF6273 domain-containing protein [bacterium]
MKQIKSSDDSSIIEHELDDIKSSCGCQSESASNPAGSANSARYAGEAEGKYGARDQQRLGANGQDGKKGDHGSFSMGLVFFVSLAIIAAAVSYYQKIYLPENEYRKADAALRAGNYKTAIMNYEALKDYKNSPQKLSEAKFYALNDSLQNNRYIEAKDYYNRLGPKDYENMRGKEDFLQAVKFSSANMFYRENEFDMALSLYREMGDYQNSRQMVNACINKLGGTAYLANEEFASGSIMKFGRFEQDNNLANGPEPIEWLATASYMEKGEQHILLISKYCLDCRPYQDKKPFATWGNCSLRRWLNRSFYNNAFSIQERERILAVPVGPDWSSDFYYFGSIRFSGVHSNDFSESKDKVFILSRWEYSSVNNKISEKTSATPYAVARGAIQNDGSCLYWLRNYRMVSWPHNKNGGISYVVDTPAVACLNSEERKIVEADDKTICVRPAIRILVKGEPIPVEFSEQKTSAEKDASEQAKPAQKDGKGK